MLMKSIQFKGDIKNFILFGHDKNLIVNSK